MPARPGLGTPLGLARIGVGFIWWTTILALIVMALLAALHTEGWLPAIITGLLVPGLGEVWRYGVEIEHENRLTV